jgi:signal transduction histidine kinase
VVTIARRAGRRIVTVVDDGRGFDGEESDGGQGLRNIKRRADAIEGVFRLLSGPGHGTALEVTLRV